MGGRSLQQPPRILSTCQGGGLQPANFMGVMHCPLCVGLAVLSAVRCCALALLIWQRYRTESVAAVGGLVPV